MSPMHIICFSSDLSLPSSSVPEDLCVWFQDEKNVFLPHFSLLHWFMLPRYAILLDPRSQRVGGKLQMVEVKGYETGVVHIGNGGGAESSKLLLPF